MYTIIENEESFTVLDPDGEYVSEHSTRSFADEKVKELINRDEVLNNQ